MAVETYRAMQALIFRQKTPVPSYGLAPAVRGSLMATVTALRGPGKHWQELEGVCIPNATHPRNGSGLLVGQGQQAGCGSPLP